MEHWFQLWHPAQYLPSKCLTCINSLGPATQGVVVVQSLSYVQLFVTPMDSSLPGSSVHGISQARVLEWAAIFFSRGSS